ncbi:YppG family protein [Salipaludibacillus daqingensis]|uniref:YppG family protein n=1 Tax=Salipaludibacillus daqingensis TaxID=3041001 RepID=UPI00247609E8|nr:YppG family protein [Salipaludibacillus daqingensis]
MFFNEPPRQQHHPYYYPYPPQAHRPAHLYHQQVPYQGYAPPQPPNGPYQQQHYPPQQKPSPKFMSAFQTSDGKFDFQKTMTTMDQVVKTANQVSPIVKQMGSYFLKK